MANEYYAVANADPFQAMGLFENMTMRSDPAGLEARGHRRIERLDPDSAACN
ncbi:hypothetical protein U8326_02590 [Tsuneonella sp. CC-YZS046]|uniref:hypothetical protein n=1 Tax=Tsuneonella sp. CC-YZS046 TaxID=3042152 RepID=UPI002D7A1785|nr:hypothetical protein [Tsuneonella sp. CC-YZS046]WRO67073.1 hypothetical protein U8326_02590 [Tsuneonella sp. CC-YZS046]